jgi:hypothetical protein
MSKTRLEDLFAIIYRFQGVAEKIPETQKIVLEKRIKLGVRSVKESGWIGSRESNRSKRFLTVLLRHTKEHKDFKIEQGPQ